MKSCLNLDFFVLAHQIGRVLSTRPVLNRRSDGQPERVFVPGTFPSNYVEPLAINSSIQLRHLLELKGGRFLLMEFLKSEFSQENLEFWIRVEEYRARARNSQETWQLTLAEFGGGGGDGGGSGGTPGADATAHALETLVANQLDTPEQLRTEVEQIYDAFISSDADSMININSENRSTIERRRKQLQADSLAIMPEFFDGAQLEIFRLLNLDSYGRFKKSPYFFRMIKHYEAQAMKQHTRELLS